MEHLQIYNVVMSAEVFWNVYNSLKYLNYIWIITIMKRKLEKGRRRRREMYGMSLAHRWWRFSAPLPDWGLSHLCDFHTNLKTKVSIKRPTPIKRYKNSQNVCDNLKMESALLNFWTSSLKTSKSEPGDSWWQCSSIWLVSCFLGFLSL